MERSQGQHTVPAAGVSLSKSSDQCWLDPSGRVSAALVPEAHLIPEAPLATTIAAQLEAIFTVEPPEFLVHDILVFSPLRKLIAQKSPQTRDVSGVLGLEI